MAWYRAGTVTTAASSTTVTGSGTMWVANARVGDAIYLGGQGIPYEITNIASDTALSINPAFTGTAGAGQAYVIVPYQGYIKNSGDRLAAVVGQYEQVLTDVDDLEAATTLIDQAAAQAGTATNVAGWSSLRVRQAIQSPLEAGVFSMPISATSGYDAGLFTPTVVGTATTGSASYSIRTGAFEKIGDIVTFTLTVAWSGHTGTGGIAITGLPYAPAALTSLSSTKEAATFLGYVLQPTLYPATTFVSLLGYNMTGSSSEPPVESSASLTISGSYRA